MFAFRQSNGYTLVFSNRLKMSLRAKEKWHQHTSSRVSGDQSSAAGFGRVDSFQ